MLVNKMLITKQNSILFVSGMIILVFFLVNYWLNIRTFIKSATFVYTFHL